jgi:hypothetical protein
MRVENLIVEYVPTGRWANVARRANHKKLSSPVSKDISPNPSDSPHSSPSEQRFAIVTNVGREGVDAAASARQ